MLALPFRARWALSFDDDGCGHLLLDMSSCAVPSVFAFLHQLHVCMLVEASLRFTGQMPAGLNQVPSRPLWDFFGAHCCVIALFQDLQVILNNYTVSPFHQMLNLISVHNQSFS